MEYYNLDELSEVSGKNGIIQVKVSRKWEQIDPVTREILRLNLIFVDRYVSLLNHFSSVDIIKLFFVLT